MTDFPGASLYYSFIDVTFFFLNNIIHPGAPMLLTSSLATNYSLKNESSLHFYPVTLQGDSSNTFCSSDWMDKKRGLLSLADQFKMIRS